MVEKIRHCDAITNKQVVRAHAPQSQEFFRNISSRATELNMRVNESKTQVLCISAAKNSVVTSYINTDCDRISSGSELKILGFWFGEAPNVSLHVEKTVAKFRARLWTLRHLKRSGMSTSDLLFIYSSIIRPVIDFASNTYHSMLSAGLSYSLECLQKRALKIIYGAVHSYEVLLKKSSIPRLSDRREEMFKKFSEKAKNNPKVSEEWFPKNPPPTHNTRNKEVYKELTAKTERLKNSPLFQMGKRLNA